MSEIQKTINYFQFNKIESNRPVDKKHVAELVAKIKKKNMLHLYPMLVNLSMDIIDGQHRLAAAEVLGEYIYYQVDGDISKSDIAGVNASSKKWTINDYINYYAVEKREGFDVLSSFMINNPLMPPSTVMMMLSSSGNRRDVSGLKEGCVDVSNYQRAL